MSRKSNRLPFGAEEWFRWRDDCLVAEAAIRQLALHAGVAYGMDIEQRGRRRARDLASFREFVGHLTYDTITDENQLELFLGAAEAWS